MSKLRITVSTLIVLLSMILSTATASAQGAIYWSPANGNDNNPGTRELPVRSVQEAERRACAAGYYFMLIKEKAYRIDDVPACPVSNYVPAG